MMRRVVPVAAAIMCLLAPGTRVPAQQANTGQANAVVSAPAMPSSEASAVEKAPDESKAGEASQEAPADTAKAAAKGAAAAGFVHQLRGRISYYGQAFKGRKTACGGYFNPKQLTMAHKTLPCGSLVRVTDTRTGKWVLVQVTDHGPNVRGRVADLSTAAAIQLGLIRHGVTEGLLDVMKYGPPGRGRPGR